MNKYIVYMLEVFSVMCVVGYLVNLAGGDFSKSMEFLRDTWLIWAIYATVSLGGYCLWYWWRHKVKGK